MTNVLLPPRCLCIFQGIVLHMRLLCMQITLISVRGHNFKNHSSTNREPLIGAVSASRKLTYCITGTRSVTVTWILVEGPCCSRLSCSHAEFTSVYFCSGLLHQIEWLNNTWWTYFVDQTNSYICYYTKDYPNFFSMLVLAVVTHSPKRVKIV